MAGRDAKGKEVDIAMSYRMSGLPAGAKLDLKPRKASSKSTRRTCAHACRLPFVWLLLSNLKPPPPKPECTVGLQLPEGGRLQGSFPETARLWEVLLHFEAQSGGTLVLTKGLDLPPNGEEKKRKADELQEQSLGFMLPVINFMQRDVRGPSC